MIRVNRPTTLPATLLAVAFLAVACDTDPITIVAEVDETYGFEGSAEGWTEFSRPGAGGAASAAVSTQQASDGSGSMRLSLNDPSGTGAVYVTRRFTDLAEDRGYDVEISFDLGSSDDSPADAWTLRAAAEASQPGSGSTFQNVGSTAVAGGGLAFEPRTAALVTSTGPDGELWVTVGVRQDGAGNREYYLDRLRVMLTRR